MKAISLWQPWASALMLGPDWKHHETRHWSTRYRGIVAIHAAKRWTFDERLALESLQRAGFPLTDCPRGVILGTARLVDCRRVEDVRFPLVRDILAGDFSDGRYAWRFEGHVLFAAPIPYRGAQGFFDIPDALFAAHPAVVGEDA